MVQSSIEAGFKLWRNEVETTGPFEVVATYIPVIALVGIYTAAFSHDPVRLTSYHWRNAVLADENAVEGFRRSLSNQFSDELDDLWSCSIVEEAPDDGAAAQYRHAYASLLDGLPTGTEDVSSNELFLARSLGYACHDQVANLEPLRLIEQGKVALRNLYPQTAEFLGEAIA